MSAPARCPGCGAKLQPDWENCPSCPLSFRDAPPEKGAFQNDAFRDFGLPILLFGGLAFVIWTMSQFLWRTAEKGAGPLEVQTPPPPVSAPAPGIVSVMGAPAKRKSADEWKLRGVIYDLVTLAPVPGVHIIFTDNATNSRAQIVSDAKGRYRVVLPPLAGRGYLVSLSKPGYHKTYLNPGTEGVSDMPLERRQELARELSALIGDPASLQPNSDTPLTTDFHMAPR